MPIGIFGERDSHRKYLKNLDKVTSTGMQMPFYEIVPRFFRGCHPRYDQIRDATGLNGPKLGGVIIEQFEFIFSFGIKLYPLRSFFFFFQTSLNCNAPANKFAHHT